MDLILTDEIKRYIKNLSSLTEKAQISQYLDRIVVVHAFRKKTRETPDQEIRTAARKREVWRQYGEQMD